MTNLCKWTKKEGMILLGRIESCGQSKKPKRDFSEETVQINRCDS